MSELNTVKLSDIADIVTGSTPASSQPDSWGETLDFITPSDQSDSYREATPSRFLSAKGARRLHKRIVPARSTNLTCIGSTIGKVSMAMREAVTNQQINSIVAKKGVAHPDFVYYLIKNWSGDLKQHASGSATPIINKGTLSNYEFLVPNLITQEAIAEVLGALDDKIAANTKLAETSSQLAQSIFAAAVTNTEGVKVGLSESSHLLSRGITPKYSEDEDTIIVLNQKCVRDQRVNLTPARRTDLAKAREEKILSQNDVLVNSTGQGTLGRVARWTHDKRVTVDSHITIIRFNPEEVDPVCAGFAVLRSEREITDMAEGSTGQTELSRIELGKLKILLPPREQQQELGQRLAKMAAMENAYLQENERLATTRDALLPQLMSGKIRVKDAEKVVEDSF